MSTSPLVSIITATYNRSNVLAFAIESIRWQTFQDWELWVIGDACTDDTEQVVASFHDPRIHFVNLPQNIGEQSGPNNIGGQYARGQYLAYLNHDDLWLPDHLEVAVKALVETDADFVFTLLEAVQRNTTNALHGASPVTGHQPPVYVPASSWVFKRTLLQEIGPWRFYRECYRIPSQDWLFRTWKAGKTLCRVPRLTVVAIQSGSRPGSYANREEQEHHAYFDRIRSEPDFRTQELAAMGFASEREALLHYGAPFWRRPLPEIPYYVARQLFIRTCLSLGCDPFAIHQVLRHIHRGVHKGALIDYKRRVRGLPPLARKKAFSPQPSPSGKDHGFTD